MNQQLVLLTLRSKKKGRKFETRSKPTVELPTAPPWPIQRSSLTVCLTPFTRAPLATFSHFIPHTKEWAGGLPTNMSVQQWSWNFVDKRCCFFQWPLKTYYIAVIQDRLEELEKLGKSLFKSSNRGHLPNMWTKVYFTNSGKIHLVT